MWINIAVISFATAQVHEKKNYAAIRQVRLSSGITKRNEIENDDYKTSHLV